MDSNAIAKLLMKHAGKTKEEAIPLIRKELADIMKQWVDQGLIPQHLWQPEQLRITFDPKARSFKVGFPPRLVAYLRNRGNAV